MGALIIAIVAGGGLELKKCSATAFYKAALIMHLHRVCSAAARKWSQMVNGGYGRMADLRYITNRRGCAEPRHARYPAWSPCSKGSAGDGHEFARLQGLCGMLIGDPSIPSGLSRSVASTGGLPSAGNLH